jgi:predicted porin
MKKTLLATALLSIGVAAQAQSSVTLYGRLDAGIEYMSGVPNAAGTGYTSRWRAESGDWGTSMWGLKGTEDLGDGLKAVFNLEGAFNTFDGSAGSTLFNRRAWVGLSSAQYGTFTLGRNLALVNDGVWAFDPFGQSSIASASLVNGRNWPGSANNIMYQSPTIGGFDVYGQYALTNSTKFNGGPDSGATQGRSAAIQLTYTQTAFQLRGIYDEIRDPLTGQFDDVFNYSREYFGGANVFIGPFKLQASYQASHADGAIGSIDRGITTTQQVWGGVTWQATPAAAITGAVYQRRRQCDDLHDRRLVQPVEAHAARHPDRRRPQQQDRPVLDRRRQRNGHPADQWRQVAVRHLCRYSALVLNGRCQQFDVTRVSFTTPREARIGVLPQNGGTPFFLRGADAVSPAPHTKAAMSDRGFVLFAGADADHALDVGHEDLAVADLAGARGADDRVDDRLHLGFAHDDLDLDLRQEIDHVFGAAVQLGVPLLTAETLDLGDGQPRQPGAGECFAHFVELERFDDGGDAFHGVPPCMSANRMNG